MERQIHLQVFLRVKSREAANKVLKRLEAALGLELAVTDCDRYWKDKSLFKANLTALLPAGDLSSVVLEMLRAGSGVARKWVVGAPEIYEGGQWEFSGTAVRESITIPGVTDLDFRVGNLRAEQPGSELSHAAVLDPL